jgi:predicted TIM-barrel fold metal-dependent hydrolase
VLRRVVDTHIHFWDHDVDGLEWAFLQPDFQHPRLGDLVKLDAPRYAVDELEAEIAAVPVEKIVHVQAARTADPVIESVWLQQLGDRTGWPNAFIAHCDLTRPDAGDLVRRHAELARFRGIRDLPAGMRLGHPDVVRGFGLVAETGASIEVMTSWEHYGDLRALVDRWSANSVVLGHAGLPVQRDDEYYSRWSAAMRRLAADAPAMVCKISAVASGADPAWTIDSIRRWVLGCIDAFGPQRCMFASNWPIDKLFGTYTRLYAAYEQIVRDAGFADDDIDSLFGATAERVYRI